MEKEIILSDNTKRLQSEMREKGAALKSFIEANRVDGALDHAKLKEFHDRDAELNEITEKFELSRKMDAAEAKAVNLSRLPMPIAAQHPKGGPEEPGTDAGAFKSLGDMLTDSQEYKTAQQTGESRYKATLSGKAMMQALKTVMTTSAGFAPQNNRGPIVVPFATRRPVIADLIPQDETENSIIRYMEFTTFTNNSAPVAEGAVKPSSALAATERDVPLQAIATLLPVTEQQLRYVPQLRAVINNVLTLMLNLTEETQLLYGNGTSPNLQGFLTKTGVGSYALSTGGAKENIADAFYAAFTQIRSVGFAEPSGVIINPNDWQIVRLMKTTQGAYIWGNPDEAGPERMWGKPVIPTMAITAGTGLTGAFDQWAHIDRALEITIEVGYINDDFARNQKTIRAEEYLALEILRPSAFTQVTGLAFVAP